MNQQKRLEDDLKLIKARLDKISETLVLLCKMNTETNASGLAKTNQQLALKRLVSQIQSLQRRS